MTLTTAKKSPFIIKAATQADESFLWEMLYEAAHMEQAGEPFADAKTNPALAKYVAEWGKEHDIGMIVLHPADGCAIAASWVRVFNETNKGYGYVREGIPELAMGTVKEYRRQGAGVLGLEALIQRVKLTHPAISLSVRANNQAAISLYQKLGFKKIPQSESKNRAGGVSFCMILEF